jgi:hypothetical protein
MRGRTFLVVRAAAAVPHFWLCARGGGGGGGNIPRIWESLVCGAAHFWLCARRRRCHIFGCARGGGGGGGGGNIFRTLGSLYYGGGK